MLAMILRPRPTARRARRGPRGVLVGIVAGGTPPFRGDPFWDPVAFSWPLLLILVAVCLVLSIGLAVWLAIQPEEPDRDTRPLVDRATRRDRERAAMVRRRLDADTGRADAAEPELR